MSRSSTLSKDPHQPSMSTPKHQPSNLDRLVSAAPIERLLATLEVEIRLRTRRFTHPQASLELEMLKSFKGDLEEALRDARAEEVIGNVKDAVRLTGRPESTVRRICGDHEANAGATLVEGQWSIHLPTFMNFIQTPRPRRVSKKATCEPSPDEATPQHGSATHTDVQEAA